MARGKRKKREELQTETRGIIVLSNAEKFGLLHHTLIRREIEKSTFFAV